MKYVKYVTLANRDKEKYELPWQELLKPAALGFPFEFIRPDEDKRVTKGSQILEAAAVAPLTEQYKAARDVDKMSPD